MVWMSPADREWYQRTERVLGPLWRVVEQSPRGWRWRLALRAYVGALAGHRWLWVRGLRL